MSFGLLATQTASELQNIPYRPILGPVLERYAIQYYTYFYRNVGNPIRLVGNLPPKAKVYSGCHIY